MQMPACVSLSTTYFYTAFYPHLVPIGRTVNEDGFGILSVKPGPAPHIRFTIMEHPTVMRVKVSHRERGLPLERGTSQNTPLMPWKRVV